ncbi:unnamed protein product [Linum tenue]|uniref:Uncharacterized protein n=1 Tax=Linum tenue TaxID=586396 RepID=A0AAV0M1F8_9ROSI|nr:unnamed protein product [Linum tenue]
MLLSCTTTTLKGQEVSGSSPLTQKKLWIKCCTRHSMSSMAKWLR